MKRYRSWSPDDPQTLADWIDNEISSGAFDEAIKKNIDDSPQDFAVVIKKLIVAGEFDEAVIERAEALGYEEAV